MASCRARSALAARCRYLALSGSVRSFRAPNATRPAPTSRVWPGVCRAFGRRHWCFSCERSLCVPSKLDGCSAELDEINSKFGEAREEVEMAMESKDTVYFDEEAGSARAAVREVLDKYKGLLARLPEAEKGAVQRSMGLKMEQLKAELERLND